MPTVYRNTTNPKFVKWSSIVAGIIGIISFILYVVLTMKGIDNAVLLYIFGFPLLYAALGFGEYYLATYTVEEDADTLTDSRQKKYPLHISHLKTITYKESRKGRYRSLFIHDDGVGFMDIRTPKKNADLMTAQLLKANPSIEVKHANYI